MEGAEPMAEKGKEPGGSEEKRAPGKIKIREMASYRR